MGTMLDKPYINVKHIELPISDNVNMALHNRINELFTDKPSAKNIELSKFCKVSRATVTDWRNGNTKTINGDNAFSVARFFGANPEWVQNGKGEKYKKNTNTLENKDLKNESSVEDGPDIIGRVPLISWVQAGNWSEIIDNHYPGDAEEWRLTTAKVSKNAFALRVVGDSMINPNGSPSLPPGVIVIVEPNREPKNGDIVIARLEDSMEATIKKLIIDGHQKFLKPLNPQYPIIQINGNCTICGVAIKVEMDL
jgi:SOS-response transcriptional repressor LexA